ncbi:MAG TPA: 5-methyltetrahydropteroyltriglutamate--homocysteine S-methyltransferase [Xanthobacteraceae bacterium]|nr:5-methyltetrahydropteroyltriglutamate--homocysteine S-methyltransferase [Xanthobacteraceae bacterium]
MATPRERPPFRADHIGSLLRPSILRQAHRDHAAGKISSADFLHILDDCIRGIVRLQETLGLKVVTDGEFRRVSYWGRFVDRTEGFEIRPASFKFRDDSGHEVEFTAPYAARKICRSQPLALDEFVFLRDNTQAVPKITLPAPSTMHFYRCKDFADKSAYNDVETFFDDVVALFRAELKELADAGCRYVQLDEVAIAMLCDPAIRATVEREGQDPFELVDLYVDAINRSVAGLPDDMSIGVHICRGNFKGNYLSEGGYDSVAEILFNTSDVSHFLLEYDTPRAGDFKPLRFVPKNIGIVLGLVSSKTPLLESEDSLRRRIGEAAQIIDLSQLAISPQCGFASTVAGNPVSETDQAKKLKLCVDVARKVWG